MFMNPMVFIVLSEYGGYLRYIFLGVYVTYIVWCTCTYNVDKSNTITVVCGLNNYM
jgi:hypothetical protein